MDTLQQRHRSNVSGLEKGLRWLLMLMLVAVFVTRFLPDLVQLVSVMPETLERSVLIKHGFAVLLLITALSLLAERSWAFLLLYVTFMIATLVVGVSLVPWVVGLLRPELASEGVIAANVLVLLIGAFCHWLQKNRDISDRS